MNGTYIPHLMKANPVSSNFQMLMIKKNEIILVMESRPARGHDDPQALLHRDTQTDRQIDRQTDGQRQR